MRSAHQMLMSRSLRTFSILTRSTLPSRPFVRSRHSLLQQHGDVKIIPVRFARRKLTRQNVLRFVFRMTTSLVIIQLVRNYVLRADDADLQEENEQKDGDDAFEVEIPDKLPENATFIPLWFGTERERVKYKASDPEWQGFLEFSRDKKKVEMLKKRVVDEVKGIIGHSKATRRMLGEPIRPGKSWLDFDFPLSAPSEYDMTGIEIADDYTAITTRLVSSERYRRMKHVLWPTSILQSFWASYSRFWSLQATRFKQYITIQPESEKEDQSAPPQPLALRQDSTTEAKEHPQLNTPMEKMSEPKSPDTPPSKSSSTNPTNPTNPPKPTSKPPPRSPSDTKRILESLPAPPRLTGDLRLASTTFMQTLLKTWRPPANIERGAFIVIGRVEFFGSREVHQYDVLAFHHPKKMTLDVVQLVPHRARPLRYKPVGG